MSMLTYTPDAKDYQAENPQVSERLRHQCLNSALYLHVYLLWTTLFICLDSATESWEGDDCLHCTALHCTARPRTIYKLNLLPAPLAVNFDPVTTHTIYGGYTDIQYRRMQPA